MKRAILISIVLFAFCISVFSQKLTEPKYLGGLIGGEDPSEFLLHLVMETSEYYLKDNPEGKLIVRICSLDDFSTAFVKAPFNPLSASNYNIFMKRIIVPYEKIFIANSPKCFEQGKTVFNEYWFVPDKITLEYDKIVPVNDISHSSFGVDDYDFVFLKQKRTGEEEKEFAESITKFVNELKNSETSEGFILYYSMTKKVRRNIEKVVTALKKENINLQRVKTAIRTFLIPDKNEKWKQFKSKRETFPTLEILTIKK